MTLVAPDILAEAKGLSVAVSAIGLGLGAALWLFGGWGQRFWLVLATTLGAGVYGLSVGEQYGVQPLVSGLLMAVAAGALALSLVHLFAFLAGGAVASLAVPALVTGWDEPFLFFFAGGFLGLFLLRYWMMALSSLAGTLLMTYCALWMFDGLGRIDCVEWASGRVVLLNWACTGVALLGFLLQVLLYRRRKAARKEAREDWPREGRRRRWFWGASDSDRRAA
jgi:hypothetical protein